MPSTDAQSTRTLSGSVELTGTDLEQTLWTLLFFFSLLRYADKQENTEWNALENTLCDVGTDWLTDWLDWWIGKMFLQSFYSKTHTLTPGVGEDDVNEKCSALRLAYSLFTALPSKVAYKFEHMNYLYLLRWLR